MYADVLNRIDEVLKKEPTSASDETLNAEKFGVLAGSFDPGIAGYTELRFDLESPTRAKKQRAPRSLLAGLEPNP